MLIGPKTRIGKVALLAAMSDEEEERAIKEAVAARGDIKLAVTFVSGETAKISATFTKTILRAALAEGVIQKYTGPIHAVLHSGLEALRTMIPSTSVSNNLKIKVAIVSDRTWVAVAVYGDSAYSAFTNHERGGLGITHL